MAEEQSEPDISLIRKAQGGCQRSLADLLDRYSPLINSRVRNINVGPCGMPYSREDLTADATAIAASFIMSFKEDRGASLGTYLMLAMKKFRSDTKKRGRSVSDFVQHDIGSVIDVHTCVDSRIREMDAKKLLEKVLAEAARMRPDYADRIRRVMEGEDVSAIARSEGVTPQAIRATINTVRNQVENNLKEELEDFFGS